MSEPIPRVQVLQFQPELTCSVWMDFYHRCRSLKSLESRLRRSVKKGEYVGYRLLTIHAEYIGVAWPKNKQPQ